MPAVSSSAVVSKACQPDVTATTLETASRAAGFEPRIVAETSDLGVVMQLVVEQIGVTMLPASALEHTTQVTRLSLTRPKLDRRILLV
jgi:DNA-binding transcriptional LysR family regulator